MKKPWLLISYLVQIVCGILGIFAFIILVINGEAKTKWIITLLLAIVFVTLGIKGIIDYKSNK